jgi:hypothetical protein
MDQLAQPASTSIDLAPNISLADIYTQALTSMRATDDISLRLLAAVPFVRQTQAELLLYMTVIVGWLATGLYVIAN